MLLITPKEVLEMAFGIAVEIDVKAIRPTKIDIAQEHFVRAKIGNQLFDDLAAGLHSDFATNYIKPPLAYYIKYGMLDELSVAVDSSGVIVKLGNSSKAVSTSLSNAQIDTEGVDKETITVKTDSSESSEQETSETSKDIEKGADNDVTEGTVTRTDTQSTASSNLASTEQETVSSDFISKSSENIVDGTSKKTANGMVAQNSESSTTKSLNKTNSQSDRSEAEKQQTAEASQFRPASIVQIQSLKARALSDANVLMRKAVRYVQNNPDMFPDFEIQQRSIY